jgi:asparagine synthetase B (glutamine-hydrolysing)
MCKIDLHEKFISDLKTVIIEQSKYKNKVLLLSGGIDSLLLLILLIDLFDKSNITTYTFYCKDTYDSKWARNTANYFQIIHKVYHCTVDEIINNLHIISGTSIKKTFDVVSYIIFNLFFNSVSISNSDIFWGEGADKLYGSTSKFIYMNTSKLAETEKCSRIQAKNILKKQNYQKIEDKKTEELFLNIMRKNNNNIISPYKDKKLSWINDLSFDIISPLNKRFVKEVIMKKYNLPKEFVNRKRTFMESGIGAYDEIKNYLNKRYGHISRNTNRIVQFIANQQILI